MNVLGAALFIFPRTEDGNLILTVDTTAVRFHSEYENQNTVDTAMNVPGQTTNPRQNSNSGLTRIANQENLYKFKLDMKFKIADMIYIEVLEY